MAKRFAQALTDYHDKHGEGRILQDMPLFWGTAPAATARNSSTVAE